MHQPSKFCSTIEQCVAVLYVIKHIFLARIFSRGDLVRTSSQSSVDRSVHGPYSRSTFITLANTGREHGRLSTLSVFTGCEFTRIVNTGSVYRPLLKICSRRDAIQIYVYLYLYLFCARCGYCM